MAPFSPSGDAPASAQVVDPEVDEIGSQASKQPGGSQGWGPDAARGMSEASRGLGLASGFVVCVIGFWLVGRAVDGWLGIEPWGQLAGALLGWALGFLYVFYAAQKERD